MLGWGAGILMAIRVGINGMGRIGRTFWRVCRNRPEIDVVAVNDLGSLRSQAHLMRYDSVRGPLGSEVMVEDDRILVDRQPLAAFQRDQPGAVPWGELG